MRRLRRAAAMSGDERAADVRRKGELTKAAINRGWPHQIAISAGIASMFGRHREIAAFEAASTCCSRGHSFCRHDVWHRVFCFSERADAEKFLEIFGGEWFDPKKLGRGARWHLLKE